MFKLKVEWNGVKVQPTSYFASDSSGVWETKEAFVTGTGGNDRLLIRESVTPGASDGSGPLIDDVILSPTLCTRSESNWICNGSFEFNEVPSGRVEIFTNEMVTGWTSNTGNICIGNDLFNTIAPDLPVAAPDGSNYLTLDCSASGGTEGIYQDIPTISGQKYRLTWKMRPQDPSRFDLEDEGVNVSIHSSTHVSLICNHLVNLQSNVLLLWFLNRFFFSHTKYSHRSNGMAVNSSLPASLSAISLVAGK